MPASDDNQWIKTTANELNNLLQVISESSQFIRRFAGSHPESQHYFDMMRSAIERSTHVVQMMQERMNQSAPAPSPSIGMAGGYPTTTAAAPPEVKKTAAPAEIGDIKIANPGGARELLLIVDDEEFVTILAQRVLTDEGYRVITAKDGFRALDVYRKLQDQIGLIILDFTMPVMDGSEVFTELRLINPNAPVVLSSGFTEQEKLKWMLAKGLRGFIPKPYTQQKLLLQVRSTLDSIKSENQ